MITIRTLRVNDSPDNLFKNTHEEKEFFQISLLFFDQSQG